MIMSTKPCIRNIAVYVHNKNKNKINNTIDTSPKNEYVHPKNRTCRKFRTHGGGTCTRTQRCTQLNTVEIRTQESNNRAVNFNADDRVKNSFEYFGTSKTKLNKNVLCIKVNRGRSGLSTWKYQFSYDH